MSKPICEIINSRFSWILKVDKMEIPFEGGYNADYFEEHYKSLGYCVTRDNEAWKREANYNG